MEQKKLITPQFRIMIGNYILTDGIKAECFSSRASRQDWGIIELSSEIEELVKINDLDEAKIELGYGDDYDELIDGHIRRRGSELRIEDDMVKLKKTKIKATFLDAAPQDIIRYILTQAEIYDYELLEQDYGKKAVVSIDSRDGLEALAEMNATWGISQPYFFQAKRFYWGSKPEQEEMYVLEEGNTILSLKKYGTLWEIDTVAIPWIHHSQIIEVRHSAYYGRAIVEKTVIKTDKQGNVHMYISFRGED